MKMLWGMVFNDSSSKEEEEDDNFELAVVVVIVEDDFTWSRLGSRFGWKTFHCDGIMGRLMRHYFTQNAIYPPKYLWHWLQM